MIWSHYVSSWFDCLPKDVSFFLAMEKHLTNYSTAKYFYFKSSLRWSKKKKQSKSKHYSSVQWKWSFFPFSFKCSCRYRPKLELRLCLCWLLFWLCFLFLLSKNRYISSSSIPQLLKFIVTILFRMPEATK